MYLLQKSGKQQGIIQLGPLHADKRGIEGNSQMQDVLCLYLVVLEG